MRPRTVIRAFWATLVVLWVIAPPFARATEDIGDWSGVDLVFLLDQSGSMGGQAFAEVLPNEPGNDSQDLRFWAPVFAMEFLNKNASIGPSNNVMGFEKFIRHILNIIDNVSKYSFCSSFTSKGFSINS